MNLFDVLLYSHMNFLTNRYVDPNFDDSIRDETLELESLYHHQNIHKLI